MYKLGESTEIDERQRKGKDVMAEEPLKKKIVIEEETVEFNKTLKRNEYSVVEQLKKLLVQIYILSLLSSSEEQ